MTSWALLLLASVLLATPGLTFCGLSPEDHDLDMADRCQDEPFFQMLAQETPQQNLTLNLCDTCRMILSWLKNCVGLQRIQMTIEKAAELVCSQFPLVENICKETINKYVNDIVQSILNAPPRQDICVTLRLCKCQVGL
ncbi:antimicrobial peptide NK-lysin-like isoform X1 [Prionailurus viverrinus]|uniref:antimicrobial peptide NK-lysin-like isoform X1 n=1 Tax=Prionailurus viverrinus TaxID=61388 RepID=UPI001FF4D66A|nr:antimicrobial peptide NK-lysin-like isoform X1 [Prionailurus viverrinus]